MSAVRLARAFTGRDLIVTSYALLARDRKVFAALPLHILASYLTAELGCAMALIGIQPQQTFADAPLTPLVQAAAENIVGAIPDCI